MRLLCTLYIINKPIADDPYNPIIAYLYNMK